MTDDLDDRTPLWSPDAIADQVRHRLARSRHSSVLVESVLDGLDQLVIEHLVEVAHEPDQLAVALRVFDATSGLRRQRGRARRSIVEFDRRATELASEVYEAISIATDTTGTPAWALAMAEEVATDRDALSGLSEAYWLEDQHIDDPPRAALHVAASPRSWDAHTFLSALWAHELASIDEFGDPHDGYRVAVGLRGLTISSNLRGLTRLTREQAHQVRCTWLDPRKHRPPPVRSVR